MSKWCGDENCLQCADKEPDPYVHLPREEYVALREQNRVLREALQPFAKVAEAIDGQVWVQYLWVQSRTNPKENICISADHVRAAKAALTATSQPQPPYKEWCRHPEKCAGLASCPQDPTCAD